MKTSDVAIVGGGIVGASVAFELARQGLRVTLLDRQQPGLEASWAAAGMLSPAPETPGSIPLVLLARASLNLYPEYVAAVEEATGHSAGFREGPAIHALFGPDAEAELSTLVTLHRGLGLRAEAIRGEDARRMEPGLNPATRAAEVVHGEARVDNRALTAAVLAAARRAGAAIHGDAEVTALLQEGSRCAGVRAGNKEISAGWVVVAAGCYASRIEGVGRYAPVRPARGQMVALRPSGTASAVTHVLRSPGGYLVPRDDGRVLAGSTMEYAGYEKRVTPAGLQQILSAAVELVPELAGAAVVETWSGLRPDTPDHLPILGPTDLQGLLMATGHFRNGILLAPITARLIGEWVTGKPASLEVEAFSPVRFREQAREAGM